ncbi:hypothetical protein C496_00050 [Natronorubrum tibetense GA33]|uniref:Uncharacterized protein n=1 Tax=Natronorubrum tibetense GA33 TaxID=1114856 RepID=L9WBC8_9EURY|nr:hypothetical protein C496_00050 [Natronorubrum tibetense GA33]
MGVLDLSRSVIRRSRTLLRNLSQGHLMGKDTQLRDSQLIGQMMDMLHSSTAFTVRLNPFLLKMQILVVIEPQRWPDT